jgi:SAM-dependent methyltransferase
MRADDVIDFASLEPIYTAMETETLRGITLAEIVGGGDTLQIPKHYIPILIEEELLTKSSRVLDVGCGCGRVSAAIAQFVDAEGSLRGIDIVPGLVEFCDRQISSRYKSSEFYLLGHSNQSYDWYRRGEQIMGEISSIDDVCGAGTADLCIATSLFTHLNADEARENLKSIGRALKTDAAAFLTFFILDPPTRLALKYNRSNLTFSHDGDHPGTFVEKKDVPSFAVAFTPDLIGSMLADTGFYIDRILFGIWSGRPIGTSFQDVIIARKMR